MRVREMIQTDIALITRYWTSQDEEYLNSLGVDLNKIPLAEDLSSMLSTQLALPIPERNSYCLIWEINGLPVGHCNTNPTILGDHAFMHLHIWEQAHRNKGFGATFIKNSIPLFFEKLELKNLYSEPYALNEAPGATLKKCGFELEKIYTTIPGSLSFEQEVKRYVFTRQQYELLQQP